MAGPVGTPIYATADGVVTFAGWQNGYGRIIKVQHEFGIETRYPHLNAIRVEVGQRVSRGERIGDMGSSGRSTGPHLHYEVRRNGDDYAGWARDVARAEGVGFIDLNDMAARKVTGKVVIQPQK